MMKRWLIAGAVGLMASGTGVAWTQEAKTAPPADAGASKPGVFYSHDFETGSLGEWNGRAWSLTTAEQYAGKSSLDMFYASTYPSSSSPRDNGGPGYNVIRFPKPLQEFHIRYYEKFSSNWKWSPIATKGWMIGEPDGARILYLKNDGWGSGTRQGGVEETKGAPGRSFPDNRGTFVWLGKNLGRWVQVEAHLRLNTPGKPDGVYREWIDGVLVRDYADVNFGKRANFGYFELSGYWNAMNSNCNVDNAPGQKNYHPDMHRYIDNVVLAAGDVMIGSADGEGPAKKR